jgi:hypothetical protein
MSGETKDTKIECNIGTIGYWWTLFILHVLVEIQGFIKYGSTHGDEKC